MHTYTYIIHVHTFPPRQYDMMEGNFGGTSEQLFFTCFHLSYHNYCEKKEALPTSAQVINPGNLSSYHYQQRIPQIASIIHYIIGI